jgi:hypothetical protein
MATRPDGAHPVRVSPRDVHLNVIGRSWKDVSSGSPMIRGILRQDRLHAQGIAGALDHPVDLGEA